MTTPPPTERFHKTVVELSSLIADLIQEIYDDGFKQIDPLIVRFAGSIIAGYNKVELINTFIDHSYMHWDQILIRDDRFFLENAGQIFAGLPMSNINAFKTLFEAKKSDGSALISLDDKSEIWDFFHSLIRISHHHLHETQRRIPGLDLTVSADKWKVKFRV